jgi:hypothetical protein
MGGSRKNDDFLKQSFTDYLAQNRGFALKGRACFLSDNRNSAIFAAKLQINESIIVAPHFKTSSANFANDIGSLSTSNTPGIDDAGRHTK